MEKHDNFDYNEILRAVQKADKELKTEIKIPSSVLEMGISFTGCRYLHYIADLKMKGELVEISMTKKINATAIAAHFENSEFQYEIYGAHFHHNMAIRQGKLLNSYQWLKEISSRNGKLYFQIGQETAEPKITVFTSHFFDRFALRTGMVDNIYEAPKMRTNAIYEYMRSKIKFNHDMPFENNGEIGIGTEKGLCLGVKQDNIILIKTFVSNDMLKGNQPIIAKETSQQLFDQFNHIMLDNDKYNIDQLGTITNKQVINRNDPCSCGSGKKYKKCCIK